MKFDTDMDYNLEQPMNTFILALRSNEMNNFPSTRAMPLAKTSSTVLLIQNTSSIHTNVFFIIKSFEFAMRLYEPFVLNPTNVINANVCEDVHTYNYVCYSFMQKLLNGSR